MFPSHQLRVVEYAPRDVMAPHCHDDALFGVVVEGDFAEQIGKSERHYASGCVTFAPVGVTHSQQFGETGARQVLFTPDDTWLAYLADCNVDLDDAPYARAVAFQALGRKLLEEIRQEDNFSPIACEGIVLEIVAAFGRADMAVQSKTSPPAWLRAARDFLHANAGAAVNMKQIARAAGRHEIHLAREFRRYFGVPVGTYLRQIRTERAAQLLRHTRSDITDIALRCGFANHAHLCRVFKAHFGVSPSQYRTRN